MRNRPTSETWKRIPGLGGRYQASDQGIVRSTESGKVIRPVRIQPKGSKPYYRFTWKQWREDGKRRASHINYAHAVALAWIGEPDDPGMRLVHKNGRPEDRTPSNLLWAYTADLTFDRHMQERGEGRASCVYCMRTLPVGYESTPRCSKCAREYRRHKDAGTHKQWCAEMTAGNARAKYQRESRAGKTPYPASVVPAIKRYLNDTQWSLKRSAADLDCNYYTFSQWVNAYRKRHNLPPASKAKNTARTRAAVARKKRETKQARRVAAVEYAIQYGAREAGKEFNTSERNVVRWKKSLGLSGVTEFDKKQGKWKRDC